MLDFLFAAGQVFCGVGLLYGFILVVAHSDCVHAMRTPYDPIIGNDWSALNIVIQEAASHPSATEHQAPRESSTRAPHLS